MKIAKLVVFQSSGGRYNFQVCHLFKGRLHGHYQWEILAVLSEAALTCLPEATFQRSKYHLGSNFTFFPSAYVSFYQLSLWCRYTKIKKYQLCEL